MAKTSKSATQSVLTKLSALRTTLTNAEQAVLDSIVLAGAADEVVAHQMQTKVSGAKVSGSKVSGSKSTPSAAPEPDEVVAHQMQTKISGAKVSGTKVSGSKSTPISIAFDAETQQYVEK